MNIIEGQEVFINMMGFGLSNESKIMLVAKALEAGDECSSEHFTLSPGTYNVTVSDDENTLGQVHIPWGKLELEGTYFICLRADADSPLIHQGTRKMVTLKVFSQLLPVWVKIVFIGILLILSGLFSGLNLGLMALDQTELKIVQNTGDDKERSYANKIFPIRKHGNYLLCSLLLGNVLVNNTLTVLLDSLTSGLVAIIGATMGIVIFGEIVPQSICSRYALAVGANTIWITKFFMVLTFPASFPISIILDKILGDEIGTVYDKKKLIELLRVTNENNDLEKEEVDIVTGALKYKEKSVRHIMTRIDDCYMLQLQSILNFETVSEIREQGYSRIPVYDRERNNIVHILFAKDLMFIDPDDNMPLAMVCEFYNNDVNFVFHDTPLNVVFNEFKSGEKGHMAFVQDVNTSGDGDPFYETIGLVTLEDIIEEIIQQEIVDETDVVIDNRTKKRRKREKNKDSNFPMIAGDSIQRKVKISPQLTLAVFQYLTTSIEPFKSQYLAEMVLKKLLTLDIYREIKYKKKDSKHVQDDEDLTIIKKGKAINFFILVIEGRVSVNIGREELMFESGPFSYFGIQTLTQVVQSMIEQHLESPSSPSFATKSALSMHSVSSQEPVGSLPGGLPRQLRKVSTQNCLETASIPGLSGKRNSTDITSVRQSPNFIPFVPDYTVKAVSDVLYVKVTRATYLRAVKASLMTKKQSNLGDMIEKELDNFLDRVNEDDIDGDTLIQTPILRSPDRSINREIEVTLSARRESLAKLGAGLPGSNNGKKLLPIKRDQSLDVSSKEQDEFWDSDSSKPQAGAVPAAAVVPANGPVDSNKISNSDSDTKTDTGSSPSATVIAVKGENGDASKPDEDGESNRTSLLSKAGSGAS